MQFLEMMDFKSSTSRGFLLLWSHVIVLANILLDAWVDMIFLQALRNSKIP